MTTDVIWMTPAALERLREELTALTTPPRELTERDRARVVELQGLISRTEVTEKPDDGLVEPGMRITARKEQDGSVIEFVLGSRALLDLDVSLDATVYSPESPLGAAINGLHVGDTAEVRAPKGPITITILSATPVA
ncbi:GreA/GreB family elongation factor [Demequina sp. TTPB684]|uniref:GreA/GreB family elongation factor n=1 Tax=unclassified Demequina TaxID=2620311 RepID=UPI001CF585BC|nr:MULTISPECIES: GreA/GreB family elongation factor [unclassified Demequina]MCB2411627.1 GreA/GreB family elongation factor [Demequina sp. TTPB684]UPU88286.1 GreA/GreB family elongation factor [Demequina sp. TMPB413]